MLKKERYYFVILGIVVGVLSISVIVLKAKYVSCELQNKSLLDKEVVLTNRIFELGNILRVQKNDTVIFFSKDESFLELSNITNSSPKLALIIDPDYCNTCIIEALDYLALFNSRFGKENALVFIETKSDIILKRTVLDFGISNLAVGYRNGQLFPFSQYMQRPYFVILLPDGFTFAFYFAIENYPDITEKYLLSLRKSYFQDWKLNPNHID